MSVDGQIHSFETCGTVDGPGIRFVVFCQGCHLKCLYCHNPDTWKINGGKTISAKELVEEAQKYKSFFFSSRGGITLSGGEPLLQPEFATEIFKQAHKADIHTALDTSGCISLDKVKNVLAETDLVLLDLKAFDEQLYKKISGGELSLTLKFAEYLTEKNICTWIRFVYVPGLTDNSEMINKMATYLAKMKNIEKVEILPFHKMGEYKWSNLELAYQLTNTSEPTQTEIEKVKKIFSAYNLKVV
jgi:pyruvate formate lyase activating enzyme